jgi:xanthine dehydrogenase large subunit
MIRPDPQAPTTSAIVGRGVADESAHLHVSGTALFVDDLPEPHGTVHVALGLSRVAHGRIRSIDPAPLAQLPGVLAVLTAAQIPGENNCGTILKDEPILAEDLVTYVGQPILAVIASDRASARLAASRVADVVCIDPLPAVLDHRAAHAAGDYVIAPQHLERSTDTDVGSAIASAPHRLRGTFDVGGQEHFYLESQVTLVVPGDQGLLVRTSTQHPTEVQKLVAKSLGVPNNAVRVECRRMGGGFGGKESQAAQYACIAAIASDAMGRPAKLRLDRGDDDLSTGKRHGFWYEYDVGYDDDGRILGYELTMVSQAGHSADLSAPVLTRAMCHVDNAYWLPNVAIHGFAARTNIQSSTAFRGFGGPQGALVTEVIVDTIARHLHQDPLDVRRRNFYGTHSHVRPGEPGNVTPYGQEIHDNVIEPLVAQLEQSSEYRTRRLAVDVHNAGGGVVKRGLALTPVKFGISFNLSHFNQAGALVHVYTDGSVLVNHSATEMGQGVNTKVRQVVAQELGISLNHVRSSATDTDKVANTSATAASTGSDMNGKAAQQAAQRIRERLTVVAADRLHVPEADIVFAGDRAHAGDKSISFVEVVAAAYVERVQLWADGFYATPGLHWHPTAMKGHPFFYFCYGAAVSEVAIDTLTGESRVLRADLLYDVGRSLNPAIDIGQVEGAFVQGMGWLTMEQLLWDQDTGRLLTMAPTTYKIPTANDVPADFRVELFENASSVDTIHLSKAVGEPPLLLAFSVLLAIRDAISSVGGHRVDPQLRAPATPEEILRVVREVRAADR